MEWLLEVRNGLFAGRALSFRSYQYLALLDLQVSDGGPSVYSVECPSNWEPVCLSPGS